MADLQTRVSTLLQVIERWLSNENEHLLRSVEQTADEKYFSFADIQFALKSLRGRLNCTALQKWIAQSGLSDQIDAAGQNVLCLHAGNIPLVGFQNALAVLLSGARYSGKISSRDPYLLPAFLNEVKKTPIWSDVDVQWTHRLDDFEGMRNDAILFAGSRESVAGVRKALKKYDLQSKNTRFLIRTAHFSMAYIHEVTPENLDLLVDGILRHGGQGCRSVTLVVAPKPLAVVKNSLRKKIKAFWKDYPPFITPQADLQYQKAYNDAIQREQLWMEKFLIQESGLDMGQDFLCYWIKGGEKKAVEVAAKFSEQLQSMYVADKNISIPGYKGQLEPLYDAQNPPIYWKPDGVDTLAWLIK